MTATEQRTRLAGVDRLRGLAVALMVVDHVLATWPTDRGYLVRITATRASLPLFCLVAGLMVAGRQPSPKRLALVIGAGIVATVVAPPSIARPDVLLVLALGLVVAGPASSAPPPLRCAVMCAAIIQATTWPIAWDGYQPGTIVALLMVGALMVERAEADRFGRTLPRVFEWFGRWPLTAYVGHLVVLGALWVAL